MAPFLKLGTLLAGNLEAMSYGTSLSLYDPYIVNGQRVFMETCWLPALDSAGIAAFIETMATLLPGLPLFTHEFRGAASRVPAEATAFGLRRDHEIQRWPDWIWTAGAVCAIDVDKKRGVIEAGADPRRAAYALGW